MTGLPFPGVGRPNQWPEMAGRRWWRRKREERRGGGGGGGGGGGLREGGRRKGQNEIWQFPKLPLNPSLIFITTIKSLITI